MGYRIRYGKPRWAREKRVLAIQGILAAGLTAAGLLACLVPAARGWMAATLAGGPGTTTERAVAAMAEAMAAGEGVYHGMVVWCRTVLERTPD